MIKTLLVKKLGAGKGGVVSSAPLAPLVPGNYGPNLLKHPVWANKYTKFT